MLPSLDAEYEADLLAEEEAIQEKITKLKAMQVLSCYQKQFNPQIQQDVYQKQQCECLWKNLLVQTKMRLLL